MQHVQVFQEMKLRIYFNSNSGEIFCDKKKEACEVSERKFAVADVALAWPFQRSLNEKVVKGTIVVCGELGMDTRHSQSTAPNLYLHLYYYFPTSMFLQFISHFTQH